MTSKNRVLKDTAARSGSRGVLKGRGTQSEKKAAATAAAEANDGVANTLPALPLSEALRQQLSDHIGALRFVNGTLAVCAQALRQQNAEMDADIALVIQRTAGDKLDATIDQIEELVVGLELQEVA